MACQVSQYRLHSAVHRADTHALLMEGRDAAGRGHHRQPVGQDHRGGRPARVCPREDDQSPHVLADTISLLVGAIVHPGSIQDRDGARVRSLYPWLRHVFADSAYAGDKLRRALKKLGNWTLLVKRFYAAKAFVLLPRR
jgi:hypothetical protein